MATKTKFPYGKVEMFGREIPLTKDQKLNKVSLSKLEKEYYEEHLKDLEKQNKELIMKDLAAFFNSKKK